MLSSVSVWQRLNAIINKQHIAGEIASLSVFQNAGLRADILQQQAAADAAAAAAAAAARAQEDAASALAQREKDLAVVKGRADKAVSDV